MSTPAPRIRPAAVGDAPALARIFAEAVEDGIATFDTTPLPAGVFAERIVARLPLLVAERDGAVVAWAGVLPYSDREAYGGIGLYSIFVARAARGAGIGTVLLRALVEDAQGRGLHKLVGRIFTSNASSIAIAHACGFRRVGIHRRHGRAGGAWRDVVVVERLLGEAADPSTG